VEGYPQRLAVLERKDIARVAFHIGLLVRHAKPGGTVCDVGGGVGLFSVGCAAAGYQAVLIDDFRDAVNIEFGQSALAAHHRLGVHVVSRDAVESGLGLARESLDAVTSFDMIEHLHNSPKRLYEEMVEALRPGGYFLLGAPNCLNLRKRLSTPLGRGGWSPLSEWYETPRFRGHVREPSVADLRYIARQIGLERIRVHGRNWTGLHSHKRLIRSLTSLADRPLRLRPALCGDIYVEGYKRRALSSRAVDWDGGTRGHG
jgi:SAM-dependent methyltransferase